MKKRRIIYLITTLIFIILSATILSKTQLTNSINATLSYFYTLIIATVYYNIKAAKYTPKYDKDFIIILGSQIKNDGTLTPLLRVRVDKAIDFGNKQYETTKKKIVYVPSGGKDSDEVIAEAEAIKNYLIKQGIDKKTNYH